VTSDTITIGISLLDLGTLERTGMVAANGSVEERRRMWELLLSDINEAGGAAGRTLQAVFVQHDPIGDPDSPAKNCRRLAEDHRVFAIVPETGWTAPAAVCSTRQHGLPTFPYDGYDLSVYAQSGGLLFTATGMNDRVLYDEVNVLHERGLLRGRTIGLVTVEGTQAPERTQIPALRSLGYRLAHHSHLSDDLSTAQSQIPVELQRMRANNVDFIIWAGGPLYPNVWITQAQRMGYNPTYSFSSLMSGTDDFAIQAVSGQIDGFAWDPRRRVERNGNRPEGQLDRQCTQRVAQGTGVALAADRQADLYWNAVVACSTLRAIVDALNASGPNPTRQTFAAAVANLGQRQDLETGPADVGGSWRPGKPDAPDFVQEMRHDPGCRCWRPHGNWIEMRLLPG
jgi:ABC-type branched-subunit amino acid transport system substrate-binding protein